MRNGQNAHSITVRVVDRNAYGRVYKVIASEGMVEMQAEVLELLNSVDTKLDYRSFLAATMEKVDRDDYPYDLFENILCSYVPCSVLVSSYF